MSSGALVLGEGDETRPLVAHPREYTFQRFRLQVLEGPDRGTERVSDAAELVIGTAPGTQLTLGDPSVSRHHCVITVTPKGFLLRDLGSTNGTTLAGFRIESAYLKNGVTIGAGRTSLRFDTLAEQVHEPLSDEDRYGRVLGESAAMRRIFGVLPKIAASDSTVLLDGETGTGKGLLAEAIHQRGPRAGAPFVVVDCSSIPPNLIEAELFGHAKGAFTGAHTGRAGAFEAANGGTIFLDEIGELPIDMQPKLLRALEERVVKRVGTVDPIRLDVRVIAATNRDLRQEVNRGAFRSDLFYRLNVVRLRLPSLRERREDIPLLAAHFYAQLVPTSDEGPPAELVQALLRQDWPGNVRELRATIERSVLMDDPELWREIAPGSLRSFPLQEPPGGPGASGASGVSGPSAPPPKPAAEAAAAAGDTALDAALSFRVAKERAVAGWERTYLRSLLRAHSGNLSAAARTARMDRNHLRELLRRHAITAGEE
jgi:two-component system response regulator GlrR